MYFLLPLFLIFNLSLANATSTDELKVENLETVTLQLKWFHQFQFAGYYAAKEKGYYAEQGLDVNFIERSSKINVVDQVLSGAAQYGIEDSGLIVPYANGAPIAALAAVFQHSPFIFVAKQSSGIISPYEMIGKRIMFAIKDGVGADEVPLQALLNDYGIKSTQYTHIKPSFNYTDLIEDKVDVMSGYSTNLPYYFQQKGVEVNVINPLNYGIDFYGDLLFTSQQELTQNPGRAQRFRKASLKGWQYALNHSEEIIQLIYKKYHSKLDFDLLRYEAKEMQKLILADTIPIGEIKASRLRQVANFYTQLDLAPALSDKALDGFVNIHTAELKLSKQDTDFLNQFPFFIYSVTTNRLPFSSIDNNGKFTGIIADYLLLFEKRLGVSFKTNGKVKPAGLNTVDIRSNLLETEINSDRVLTDIFHTSPVVIVMHKHEKFVDNIKSIANKKIALLKGSQFSGKIIQKYPELNVHWVNSNEQGLMAVSTSQVDVFMSCLAQSTYSIEALGLGNIRIVGKTEFNHHFRFSISKELAPLVTLFNRALSSMTEAEKIGIVNNWGGEEKFVHKIDYGLLFNISAILISFIVLIGFWNKQLRKEIVKRKKLEEELRLASTVYENTTQSIMVCDADNYIIAVNPSFTQLTGYSAQEVIGKTPKILKSGQHSIDFYNLMWGKIKTTGSWQGELWNKKKNGDIFAEWLTINTIFNANKTVSQRVSLFSDITDKKLADEKIWAQANFDSLTQLANRSLFIEHLQHEILLAQRSEKHIALLFLDLDHFKEVNDSLGHDKGDVLLIEAAKRINNCVRESDFVARLGGDEFTVILTELDDKSHIERVAESIITSLSEVFYLDRDVATISSSIGIAVYPRDASDSTALIKCADQAMYRAKNNGRSQFRFFTQSMQLQVKQRQLLLNDLHIAIKEGQLENYYQPIMDINSGLITKAETLLRWKHPEKGLVHSSEFIEIADDAGLLPDIGDWSFKQAIKDLKYWQKQALSIQLSFNLSETQVRATNDSFNWTNHLREQEVTGHKIIIDIAEGLLITDNIRLKKQLEAFKECGMQVAVDNCGTANSAMYLLNKFSVDYLKIDRSFIADITIDSKQLLLCESIIAMAHKLGLKVIAEGIETEEQKQLLFYGGCDFGQGFLISKPLPADVFLRETLSINAK